ncbi:restriction endonuclease subunit S [Ruminococcus champanellensis]|uniref:restriction endonuclease subunit S n=1 Tax=Ruminococcus champanellensis TaxID=1161942 RepID=UPI0039F55236
MRTTKDSGISWLGEYPSGWELKKIKYCLQERVEKNNPIRTTEILSLTAKQGVIPYDQKEGGGNKPKEDVSAYRLAYPGDIVMNSMNILSGSVGLSQYFGCVSPVYYMLRPWKAAEDVRYYNYIFQTTMFQRSLFGLGNGILIKESGNGKLNTIRMRIPMDKFGGLFIPVAPIDEQKRIADFLDAKCAEIDALTADIQTQIDTLEQYKRSVITETVTKGLNPDAEMKDSGIEWVGEIPVHWPVHPVYSYYGERKNKNRLGKEDNLLSLSYGRVIRKDINTNDGLLPESFNTYNIVEAGDIIIRPTDLQNDKRSLRTGLVKEHGIITSAYIDLCPLKQVDSRYFHFLLHAYDVMKVFYNMGNGVRQGLNYSEFSRLMVFEPPYEEQVAMADYLETKVTEVDAIIEQKKEQMAVLDAYKRSLIFEYVTGKKEVI